MTKLKAILTLEVPPWARVVIVIIFISFYLFGWKIIGLGY